MYHAFLGTFYSTGCVPIYLQNAGRDTATQITQASNDFSVRVFCLFFFANGNLLKVTFSGTFSRYCKSSLWLHGVFFLLSSSPKPTTCYFVSQHRLTSCLWLSAPTGSYWTCKSLKTLLLKHINVFLIVFSNYEALWHRGRRFIRLWYTYTKYFVRRHILWDLLTRRQILNITRLVLLNGMIYVQSGIGVPIKSQCIEHFVGFQIYTDVMQ